jgi:hypothetical protein
MPYVFVVAAIALISTQAGANAVASPVLMLTVPVAAQVHWIAPPPPRIVVTPAPRAGWVWSPGYWRWTGREYFWVAGRWLPERRGYGYVPAHWERALGGWIFVPARWLRRPL